MARHAFYRFFVGDYLRDAGHLSLLEHGAYRRLIDLYMIDGAPIPFDLPRLYRLLHATSKEEQQAVQTVIEEFFVMEGTGSGKLRHKRCDREIAWQDSLSEKARIANQIRWGRIEENQKLASARIADGIRMYSEPEPEPEPEPKKKKNPPLSPPAWICPPNVSPEAWTAWLDVRKRLKSPMTEFAYKRAANQLAVWTEAGHNADAIVAASAANGWKGLFEPKGTPAPARPKSGETRKGQFGEEIFYEGTGWVSND